jgi:hypothetical protein
MKMKAKEDEGEVLVLSDHRTVVSASMNDPQLQVLRKQARRAAGGCFRFLIPPPSFPWPSSPRRQGARSQGGLRRS